MADDGVEKVLMSTVTITLFFGKDEVRVSALPAPGSGKTRTKTYSNSVVGAVGADNFLRTMTRKLNAAYPGSPPGSAEGVTLKVRGTDILTDQ